MTRNPDHDEYEPGEIGWYDAWLGQFNDGPPKDDEREYRRGFRAGYERCLSDRGLTPEYVKNFDLVPDPDEEPVF